MSLPNVFFLFVYFLLRTFARIAGTTSCRGKCTEHLAFLDSTTCRRFVTTKVAGLPTQKVRISLADGWKFPVSVKIFLTCSNNYDTKYSSFPAFLWWDINYVASTPRVGCAKMSLSGQKSGQSKSGEGKCYREIQSAEWNLIHNGTAQILQGQRKKLDRTSANWKVYERLTNNWKVYERKPHLRLRCNARH